MEFTNFTLKLVILLFPGLLGTVLIEKLVLHKPWNQFRFIMNVILVSSFSYFLLQLFSIETLSTDFKFKKLEFWNYIENSESTSIPFAEVFKSTLISIFISGFVSLMNKNGWINQFGQYLQITNKYGQESVYYRILNSKNTDWIYLRDIENNITYLGQVSKYNEDDKIREIVLNKVQVFRYKNSKFMYSIDTIYLTYPIEKQLIIEIPNTI
jgi:hypothetical protein